ncbi:hypothetical protein [Streptomyces sp. NPDC059168]|uniref:hypothetical protein n=1 Tax=Streptomyces sp. NPDC059168 TaxID=3346753 RepID=UPI00367C42DA
MGTSRRVRRNASAMRMVGALPALHREAADPDEVAILTQRCATLRSRALTPEDTRELLDRLPGEQ